MSASSASSRKDAPDGAQRQMYRYLRAQAVDQQRRRQQKIERLVREHAQRALPTFRHPSR